ncbi:hypothetical protein [Oerskovia enterophila]|uniref:Uncharacterized protein n=1 Tax=Oerskovia enterophila TaxID=43678 RepID=A0A163TA00_9CELL|nr:hypothetical protein [Oerskovia enterophila]KZM37276.1 hypothetical protein OJAG_00130 [Oerskovia enterophila]OCI29229.1 hypothetical protein OERS_40920 [Oerskovia enterophila]
MTALRPAAEDTGTPPDRLAAVAVPLGCGALAAFGAAVGPALVVGVLFAPAVMLPLGLLLLVGIAFANAAILRAATGRRRIGLAFVLTLLVPAAIGAELVAQGEIPLDPRYGVPVPVVIGALVAGISTFALPRWAKLFGGLTIVLVAVLYGWQAASDAAQEAAAARASNVAAREAMYDNLLPGATTTLTGARTDLRTLTGEGAEVGVDRDGRELTITMSVWGDPGEEDPDGFACWLLSSGEASWIVGQTYADFADRCRIVDGGWARPDGLTFGTYRDGYWVTVDAGPAATVEDVAAVASTLTDVPEIERRAHWEAMSDLPAG